MKWILFLIFSLSSFLSVTAQDHTDKLFYIDRLYSSIKFSIEYLEIMEFNGKTNPPLR
ncbi:hypothetical protein [Winogradskyella sp.]|uniref:hypothetical protein n=1 Tax=Winogradskyella sp. TaxID=1883156 RepID=UPI003BAC2830